MSKIFIPKTCRVGFQKREDTFTKKLAYVIYYDAKGVLRKEKSWSQWCSLKKIEPRDFENAPTSGFVLNKGHTRYAWSHFGERRTVIRIYDPRGVEFEITPENLIALLMHTDCSKREIQDDLVYAWKGTELMLLPCSSEEYKSALNYTSLQGVRVGAKDLQEGFTYVTKNEEHLVYLGRHLWHEIKHPYDDDKTARVGKKQHIFYDPNWKGEDKWSTKPKFKPVKSVSSTISKQVSDGCHDEFANWVEAFLKSPESSKVVGWEKRPLPAKAWEKDWDKGDYTQRATLSAAMEENGHFVTVTIARHRPSTRWNYRTGLNEPLETGPKRLSFRRNNIVKQDGSFHYALSQHYYAGESDDIVGDRSKFFVLYAAYENGLKEKWSG